jgi:2-polyprenyl-6-methoxyphenol hydroxylase-like FAD-dependent oxidoreductase
VRRSELDELLFRTAGEAGARTLEGHRAREVQFDADGARVEVERDDGTRASWRCRYLVDASGRDTLLANKFKTKKKHPEHNSSALFGHFRGARRLEGKLEGNITIFWFDHGWFWFIPLADGTTSIGAVVWPYYLKSRSKPVAQFFQDTIAMCPQLAERLRDATWSTGRCTPPATTPTWAPIAPATATPLLGDAYAFVDPVVFLGVYLAMSSAFAAMPLVEATLQRGPSESGRPSAPPSTASRATAPRSSAGSSTGHQPDDARLLHGSAQPRCGSRKRCSPCWPATCHGKTPFRLPLNPVQGHVLLVSFAHPVRTWNAWRRRRHNIRELDAATP